MWPTPSSVRAFAARRARLATLLGGAPAVLPAGLPPSRNYPANRYPFRAGSHFLFCVGKALPGAALWLDAAGATLYVEEPPEGDAMWHGPAPSCDALARELEIDVKPLPELAARVRAQPHEVATVSPNDDMTAAWLTQLLGRAVAPRASAQSYAQENDVALAKALVALRLRHDSAAVEQLRQAAAVTALAHARGLRAVGTAKREAEVLAAMVGCMFEFGMVPAYEPIVTVRGEVLHDSEHHRELNAGDLLLVDVGAETPEGFAGDVTRDWPVSGRFSPTQRALYEVVLAAQEAAIAQAVPGQRYRDIHITAARVMLEGFLALGIMRGNVDDLAARGAYAVFFPHGVGHLIGADVHDLEDLGDLAGYAPGRQRATRFGDKYLRLDRDLEPGMAVTIEPGFYQVPAILSDRELMRAFESDIDRRVLAQFADVRGIRIEDDVLVTSGEPEVLSRTIPKQITDVEAAIASAREQHR